MHLALVCFFSEADARKLARDAGRKASKSYTTFRLTGMTGRYRPERSIFGGRGRAYDKVRAKTIREAIQRGESEAAHFSIVEFYGCFLV